MRIREIAAELEELGLDEEEAELYVRLLQTGPAKVSTLTSFFDVSRSKLYRMLDELAERGYVNKSLGRPTIYEPQPPDAVFDTVIDELRLNQQQLEELRTDVQAPLDEISAEGAASQQHHWKRLEGTGRIHEALHAMVTRSEESLWTASSYEIAPGRLPPLLRQAWTLVTDRANKGLEVKAALNLPETPAEGTPSDLAAKGISLRRFPDERPIHFILVDRRDVILWARSEVRREAGVRESIGLWTDAPGVVAACEALFETLWEKATPVTLEEDSPGSTSTS